MREPESQDPAERISLLMRELMALVGKAGGGGGLQVFHRQELTLPQIVSLRIMRDHGPQTVSAIAGRVRLTAGAVSRLVDQLVEKHLVDRTESEKDRRKKVLRLTAAGARLINQFDSARAAGLRRLVARLDRTLAGDLLSALERVVGSLREIQSREREG
jgi:DNA-binding MarR family transcriptional regulator